MPGDSVPLRPPSYLSAEDATRGLVYALGFLDGLAAGLAAWSPADRQDVIAGINGAAMKLGELMEGQSDG
jgi:NADPH-dependent 2,4-dienoyl-CoA reductase/sulfur reductase-like enzyme